MVYFLSNIFAIYFFLIKGSPDLRAAKEVADYLGTVHHEFYFTVQVLILRIFAYYNKKYVLCNLSFFCIISGGDRCTGGSGIPHRDL